MLEARTARLALAGAIAALGAACASAGGPWDRHDEHPQRARAPEARPAAVCPVVLSNETDQRLDVGYVLGGVTSVLGLIPAGRSLSFSVSCDPGSIEAFGVASGFFLGGGDQYRTVASLDPDRATRMGFTLTDRIR